MVMYIFSFLCFFFFFNDTATTEIYTLSLHDALPILPATSIMTGTALAPTLMSLPVAVIDEPLVTDASTMLRMKLIENAPPMATDRKSTRLNSSHSSISYAVFCLKKKKKKTKKLQNKK